MATYTPNYGLHQWVPEDQFLREEFNQDNAIIDGILGEHSATLANCGNCRIEFGSYVGKDAYGNKNNTLSFSGRPLVVLVADGAVGGYLLMVQGSGASYLSACVESVSEWVSITWEENSVHWWSYSPTAQLNVGNRTYYYLALLAADDG